MEFHDALVFALLLVLFGVELGMLVSVACHKDHLVRQDIRVHLLQHFTNGAKTGGVTGVKTQTLKRGPPKR